jgi:hypothetical protein
MAQGRFGADASGSNDGPSSLVSVISPVAANKYMTAEDAIIAYQLLLP